MISYYCHKSVYNAACTQIRTGRHGGSARATPEVLRLQAFLNCACWAEGPRRNCGVESGFFDSGGDRRGVIGCEIVPPQRDGEGDDGETAYNDCPRLGTKPLEPLRIELDRAEDRRGGDDPTTIGASRP